MQYITINDFLEYGGQLEDENRFKRHEYRARMFLDLMTLGRIDDEIAKRESVKRCMYELIESYEQEYQQTAGGIGVSSVSNDGVSVSYSSDGLTESVKKRCTEIIRQYLMNECSSVGIPLLYKGVFCD